jgi:hypothetical protein
MKKISMFCLLLVSFFQVQAQSGFRPGYILQHGDTLKGWIKTGNPKDNGAFCEFRSNLNGESQKYNASEIKGYGLVEGMHYRRYILSEYSQTVPVYVVDKADYFLNVLVDGKANLYYLRDKTGKDRFFIEKDTIIKELESKEFTERNPETGILYKGESKIYLGTLTYLLSDCKTMQSTINFTRLRPLSLTNTVKSYNQCIHPDSLKFVQKPFKNKTTYGVTFGPNYSQIAFISPGRTSDHVTEKNAKTGFSAGLSVNRTLPVFSENLSLQAELLFFRSNYKTHYRFIYYDVQSTWDNSTLVLNYHFKSDITLNSLKMPFQVRYTFNLPKVKPYLNAGLVLINDLSFKETCSLEFYYQQEYTQRLPEFNKQEMRMELLCGAGVAYELYKHRSVFLDLKYMPQGRENLTGFEARIRTWSLNTGFTF